jgi:hypothetical protein
MIALAGSTICLRKTKNSCLLTKSKLLKLLDDLEERLIIEVASTQEKNEAKKREKDEMSQLTSVLRDNQEIEFIKEHDIINSCF